jgi:hypothetical protein
MPDVRQMIDWRWWGKVVGVSVVCAVVGFLLGTWAG